MATAEERKARMKNKEKLLHWSDEKEVIKSSRPLKLLLTLMLHIPICLVLVLVYPVSFFYLIFSRRARTEAYLYQKQLKKFTHGESPKIISPFRQILSFSLCVLEKMEGWLGKVKFEELVCHDDDLHGLIESLEKKQGAVLIGSHLGNIELLRSLSSFNRTGVKREVPVTVIMETKSTEQFNNTLKEVNPNAGLNIISPQSIGPDTMILLQEHIQNGGLVVFAADRTSASARTRSVRLPFLGKAADFPYGVFLLTLLLNAPTYFVFALRTKTASLHPRYNMFVERAETPLAGFRAERDKRIHALCEEYVGKLEKYCKLFPYQWYNFYNFWLLPDSNGEV